MCSSDLKEEGEEEEEGEKGRGRETDSVLCCLVGLLVGWLVSCGGFF